MKSIINIYFKHKIKLIIFTTLLLILGFVIIVIKYSQTQKFHTDQAVSTTDVLGTSVITEPDFVYNIEQYQANNEQKFVILDLRTTSDFKKKNIPGSININLYNNSFRKQIMALDHKQSYLIYSPIKKDAFFLYNEMLRTDYQGLEILNVSEAEFQTLL
ncbi:MAG: rhodanese-like domain-containing protein [bacterium]